jgi:outer membrane protein assembly factor BamE (lipoprotein component of BamABCDE complex)
MVWARPFRHPAILAMLLAATLASCTRSYRNHGYAPSESELAQLELGVDTQESVVAKVGRPNLGGVVREDAFFYVQSRFSMYGFRGPQEISREVLVLSFGADGTLRNVERFGLEDGRVVALSRRTTEGVFEDNTFIRQILGNVGQVDAGALLGEE